MIARPCGTERLTRCLRTTLGRQTDSVPYLADHCWKQSTGVDGSLGLMLATSAYVQLPNQCVCPKPLSHCPQDSTHALQFYNFRFLWSFYLNVVQLPCPPPPPPPLTLPSFEVPATWPVAMVTMSGCTVRLRKIEKELGSRRGPPASWQCPLPFAHTPPHPTFSPFDVIGVAQIVALALFLHVVQDGHSSHKINNLPRG